jgi:hypothetical protein
MSQQNHLTPEELIDYHYGESARNGDRQQHLAACPGCASEYATLVQDLGSIADEFAAQTQPARSAEYAEHVWTSLSPRLSPLAPQRPARLGIHLVPKTHHRLRLALALATAAAALAAVAFYSGQLWEKTRNRTIITHNQQPPQTESRQGNQPAATPGNPPQAPKQQVIVFVLSDHLDRSERLLVELSHPEEAAVDPALKTTARELLTENRLYRQRIAHSSSSQNSPAGDESIGIALQSLERVLSEVANDPGGLSPNEIKALEKKLNTDSLLFEVRVLRSRVPGGNAGDRQKNGLAARKGRTA